MIAAALLLALNGLDARFAQMLRANANAGCDRLLTLLPAAFFWLFANATPAQEMGGLPAEARNAGDAWRRLAAQDAHTFAKNISVESRRNFQEEAEPPKSRCSEATRQFCSDLANAQFEFKPLKVLLPDIPRLTPHNVYIRRNKVTVAYTFR
jgi:hypothetical protein